MGQGRQYPVVSPSTGGKTAACILAVAMLASVAILGAAVFLGIRLASLAGDDAAEDPPPPPPFVPDPLKVQFKDIPTLQLALLFLDAQKAGFLPVDYPITWRNDSGLSDGFDQNRNLTGGFYDGGGTTKYTFPMAFSVTVLSWSVIEYQERYENEGLLETAVSLIQWGVDYLLAATYEHVIFAQVGMPELDEACWTRPEDMPPKFMLTPYPCEAAHPCSDLAGEMAAALAAASIIFRQPDGGNTVYADQILSKAVDLWKFADLYRGLYSDWVVEAQEEYNSTDYKDELLWGASWLYYATGDDTYLTYLLDGVKASEWLETAPSGQDLRAASVFNWDKKSPGVMVLLTRLLTLGYGIEQEGNSTNRVFGAFVGYYAMPAKQYVGQFLPKNTQRANFTRAGTLTWAGPRDVTLKRPLELAIGTAFLATLLVDYLYPAFSPGASGLGSPYVFGNSQWTDVTNYCSIQKNYILGVNPINMSYVVGWVAYGKRFPTNVYHKAASIPSKLIDPTVYSCMAGNYWLQRPDPNPNVLYGAVMGGPDRTDNFANNRTNRYQSEPKTHVNALWAALVSAGDNRPGILKYSRMWVNMKWAAKKADEIQMNLPIPSPPPPPTPPPPPPLFK